MPETTEVKKLEKRIYCVVADTVQAPTMLSVVRNSRTGKNVAKLVGIDRTRTIVQPAGRLVAQAAHVVSKVREQLLKDFLYKHGSDSEEDRVARKIKLLEEFQPITTIILSARDSFELMHVLNLLTDLHLPVHSFEDLNQPDYGDPSREVMTAIATEPVTCEEVVGVLDYLPLWKPKGESPSI